MKKIIRAILVLALLMDLSGCAAPGDIALTTAPAETSKATEPATQPAPTETQPPETTVPETEPPETEPQPTGPQPGTFLLSFAGDCTFADPWDYQYASDFTVVVGENYTYPLEAVQEYFAGDEYTVVNLEAPFTETGEPKDNLFVFRSHPKYVNILTEGSVEFVNLANNHTFDYGREGYSNTKATLEAAGIGYVEQKASTLVTTEHGFKLGFYADMSPWDTETMSREIASLREQGADIVIVSFHWGYENSYRPTNMQTVMGHNAIKAGADIVFGHHPHVLQPVEQYEDGIIYYSLGNFSFGGNGWPKDYDTAVIQQEIIREADGSVHLGETHLIPCSVSGKNWVNDYQPTPASPDSKQYARILSKLDGTFEGEDMDINYFGIPTEPTDPTESP